MWRKYERSWLLLSIQHRTFFKCRKKTSEKFKNIVPGVTALLVIASVRCSAALKLHKIKNLYFQKNTTSIINKTATCYLIIPHKAVKKCKMKNWPCSYFESFWNCFYLMLTVCHSSEIMREYLLLSSHLSASSCKKESYTRGCSLLRGDKEFREENWLVGSIPIF